MNLRLSLIQLQVFLLIFSRVSGFLNTVPIFSFRTVPIQIRVFLSFWLSLVLFPITKLSLNIPLFSFEYGLMLIKEVLIGIALGYSVTLIFAGIQLAGEYIDLHIGFGMSNMFDPQAEAQLPVTSQFIYLISILLFIGLGGHYVLIKGVSDSFAYIPLLGGAYHPEITKEVVDLFVFFFVLAVKISAPVLAAMFLVHVAMGIISRVAPQLNVFIIVFPLKLFLGFMMLYISFPYILAIFHTLYSEILKDIYIFIKYMR